MPDYTAAKLRARLVEWGYRVWTERSELSQRWLAKATKNAIDCYASNHYTEVDALTELVQRLVPFDVVMGGLGPDTTTAPTITYSPRAAGLIAAIVELDQGEVCESSAAERPTPELMRLRRALDDIRAALKRTRSDPTPVTSAESDFRSTYYPGL